MKPNALPLGVELSFQEGQLEKGVTLERGIQDLSQAIRVNIHRNKSCRLSVPLA